MDSRNTIAVRNGNWLIDQKGQKVKITLFAREDNDKKELEFTTDDVGDLFVAIQALTVHLEI